MKGQVHQLVIHTLKDDTFHAYLLIQTQEEVFYLDCRPSDGMILATLMSIPIYMSPEVMSEAGRELSSMLSMTDLNEDEQAEIGASAALEGVSPVEVEVHSEDDPNALAEVEVHTTGDEVSELDALRAQLDRLVAQEAYEEAARVRDQINELEDRAPRGD